jgi:molybdate/tungstate transport system substrate-binding protein
MKKPKSAAARVLFQAGLGAFVVTIVLAAHAFAGALMPLEVVYAGSMGAVMERGVRPEVARVLGAEFHGRAQVSIGLANLIVAGNIRPDVFIAITPGPMQTIITAHKASLAIPIASTSVVIAYSPRSRFTDQLSHATLVRRTPWWRVLETPGFRFGRTDPRVDPQGRDIIFAMQLAARYYHQPDLPDRILGATINPSQIFSEPEVMARLQADQLDASSAYRVEPEAYGLPFIALPPEVNLGDAAMADQYRAAALTLDGKVLHPSPLVFYAAVLTDAPHPELAARFVRWLGGGAARALFARYHYDGPGDAKPLTP